MSNLGKHIAAVLLALEDLAAKELYYWHAELDAVLPEIGAGAKETLRILRSAHTHKATESLQIFR